MHSDNNRCGEENKVKSTVRVEKGVPTMYPISLLGVGQRNGHRKASLIRVSENQRVSRAQVHTEPDTGSYSFELTTKSPSPGG